MQEKTEKFSTLQGIRDFGFRRHCTPKTLKNFRVKALAVPLQHDACAIFAKEKSEEQHCD
jgi:hypothetical protein